MPLTISNYTGDGTSSTNVDCYIQLPDSGTSVLVAGSVNPTGAGGALVVTGSPLTMPAAPGSGSIFWNIQVDATTGAATVQQSTSSDPATIDGNNVVIFRQTLISTSTNPALTPSSTPNTW